MSTIRMTLTDEELSVLEDLLHAEITYPSSFPEDRTTQEQHDLAVAARLLAKVTIRRDALAGRL